MKISCPIFFISTSKDLVTHIRAALKILELAAALGVTYSVERYPETKIFQLI
jgi:hypothetical protein